MDRRSLSIAAMLAFCVMPFVTACMPETPETALSWNVNDRMPVRHHAAAPREGARGPHVYVYQDRDGTPGSPPVPTPRPSYVARRLAPVYAPSRRYAGGSVVFAWPVNGQVIAGFGSTRNGEKNDGINIATPMHSPIRAAASGTVSYAGDELKGYGNLILIKHADGYVTAYAHAERLLVNRGDFVTKGQVIGYAGQTGDVDSPQLHFEIRHDTTPVDPRGLLAAKAGA